MATKFVLAVALVAAMMCGALANDVPVKFCAKACNGTALAGYQVQLSGCTDRPATCSTGLDGCCTIDHSPDVIQYCYGSATYLCQWSILSGFNSDPTDPFILDTATFVQGGNQVTPRQFSGCHCDGHDSCKPVIYQDESISTPYTVNFTPNSCACQQGLDFTQLGRSQQPTDTTNTSAGRKLK